LVIETDFGGKSEFGRRPALKMSGVFASAWMPAEGRLSAGVLPQSRARFFPGGRAVRAPWLNKGQGLDLSGRGASAELLPVMVPEGR